MTDLPPALVSALTRPELRLPAEGISITVDPDLTVPFHAGPGQLRIHPDLPDPAFHVRHGLELARLLAQGDDLVAGFAAARCAALFGRLEEMCHLSRRPDLDWVAALDRDLPPDAAMLAVLWPHLAVYQSSRGGAFIPPETASLTATRLTAIWPVLGPAEWLMETGGDVRLRVDPETGLNGYGCSHRPRPWAITYASSTASSVSERGYAGAEIARQRMVRAAIASDDTLATEAGTVRAALAAYYHLPPGAAVVLAASGTDCELFALALAQLHPDPRPITNIVIAPEETGTGVPLAAVGKHFAIDTARGVTVAKATHVDGFRTDTVLAGIAIRENDGTVRPDAAIARACQQAVRDAPGRSVLHLLDVSKTGLLAPDTAAITSALQARPGDVDVVVDACQARLSAARVTDYVRGGWIVLITGSKFFTGPPFAGAVLVPKAIAARLDQGTLPAGLADYTAAPEWPTRAATAKLPANANPGLLLRWHAALAEMHAFQAVPPARARNILLGFVTHLRERIAGRADLLPITVPELRRPPLPDEDPHENWDRLGLIVSFALRDPANGMPLDMERARAVYRWLNADLSMVLPENPALAKTRCHIGQPAPLPSPQGGIMGALRISAGARLVAGEPSHAAMDPHLRLAHEWADADRVLAKISLILRHEAALRAADPKPGYS